MTIQFVVDRHGNLDDIKVLASPHRSLSDEAVRILKNSSGDWTPGKQRGNPVAVRFTIPVDFKLQ
ncbi:energy transducer TonB [Alistipes sp. OttesenSCG-928-L06]|nr:energy transducer TonB [Alistipes sp. OttesenSCG-928-L06]